MAVSQQLMEKDPNDLKPHPLNKQIYGDPEVSQEFIESVKTDGIPDPIVVLPDMTIVSGHRRHRASILAGLESVRVVVRTDLENDSEKVQRYLILANSHRIKTGDMLAREAEHLARINGEETAVAQKSGLKKGLAKPQSPVVPKTSTTEKQPAKLKTHEIVAEQLDISPAKARQAIKVGRAIKDAEQSGQTEQAQEISKVAREQSINAAAKLIEPHKEQPDETTQQFQELESLLNKAYSTRSKLIQSIDGLAFNSILQKKAHEAILAVDTKFLKSLTTAKSDFAQLQSTWITYKPVPPKQKDKEDPFDQPTETEQPSFSQADDQSFEQEAATKEDEGPPPF